MINKKRIEDLRKEKDRLAKSIPISSESSIMKEEGLIKLNSKLSENILAHNNCLADCIKRIKRSVEFMDGGYDKHNPEDDTTESLIHRDKVLSEIDKIKNEMKIEEDEG